MMTSLATYLSEKGNLIEEQLNLLIPETQQPYCSLFHATRYSLLGAGKRIRPIMTLAAAEALNACSSLALIPACALEMVHTYSLIHDDLPCMDDDDFRIGKPSLHKTYPEGHTVLAGDFLLTHAFGLLAEAPGLTDKQRIQLVAVLSSRAGGNDGMIAGQIMDIESEGKKIDIATLTRLHQCKTGALFVASLEFGAIIAQASDEQSEILRQFGREIGLAFQILDDVEDMDSENDGIKQKSTFATLLGIEESRLQVEKLLTSALERISQLPGGGGVLQDLARWIVYRE